MTKFNCSKYRHRSGAAAVEFAVVLPVLLTLLVGVWEVGRLLHVQLILVSAAREGGRQASAGHVDSFAVRKAVIDHLNNEGIQVTDGNGALLSGVTIDIKNQTAPGVDPSVANKMDFITVDVSLPYSLVGWSMVHHFANPATTLSAGVGWYSVRDDPLTVSSTIPSQPQ